MDINGVSLTLGGTAGIKEAKIQGTRSPTIIASAIASPKIVEKNENGLTPDEQKAADGVKGMRITRTPSRGG